MALHRAGCTTAKLAREFEPTEESVRTWIAQVDRDDGVRQDGLTTADKEELVRLRREDRQLEDRAGDPLKKPRPGSLKETEQLPPRSSGS